MSTYLPTWLFVKQQVTRSYAMRTPLKEVKEVELEPANDVTLSWTVDSRPIIDGKRERHNREWFE